LISANLKSTHEALAFLTKSQSLEKFEAAIQVSTVRFLKPRHHQTSLLTAQGIADLMIAQVCQVRLDDRDRNPRSDSVRNRTNQGREFFLTVRDLIMALAGN
jgi:hypothetical protein